MKERLQRILYQYGKIFTEKPPAQQCRIIRRAGNDAQYFPGLRLYGHCSAGKAVHQPFTILLQFQVYGGSQVFARNR